MVDKKKRVNIGMELVAEPSILMCDEPTVMYFYIKNSSNILSYIYDIIYRVD